jgi:hypothetical protein
VFQQARNLGVGGKRARLLVDRDLCGACGDFGGLRSLARQLGLEEVEVITPNLHDVIKVNM